MWILLKDKLNSNSLFKNSWKYKGNSKPDTIKRRTILIEEILNLDIVKNEIDVNNITISSDDHLDAFVCWLMAILLIKKKSSVKIYGDALNRSFLLPFDEEIYKKLNSYLSS